MEENKYHFAREIIFQMRACQSISDNVYLHWIDKLINEEKEVSLQTTVAKSDCPLYISGHDTSCKCINCGRNKWEH